MFGKLTLSAVPYHEPIVMVTLAVVALLGLGVFGAITYYRKWTYLWTEWLTSVDHKKIGVMYIIVALVMLLRGFADAIMMRSQLALACGRRRRLPAAAPLRPDLHRPRRDHDLLRGDALHDRPDEPGRAAADRRARRGVPVPELPELLAVRSSASCWSTSRWAWANSPQTGWLAYPPLSGLAYSPGVGVDYYIWALQISGMGTTLTGINFFVTILKMRAPGMKLMQMPVFTWTCTFANILIVASFPILTVTLALLTLDRYLGTHFFTNEMGGNAMMYINLIWAWGHPEVYILVLPAFGVFSEVTATFAGKRMFGYTSMVWASAAITVLSFIVWLHHFFTMGAGANVNAFFGIATMIISIPTGVKIFNWLFTMYRGRLRFTTPMLWTLGFMVTFTIGGMTGVLLAIPGADFVLHNSLFLIAHFHNAIIGGVVFGCFAGFTYWFPKAFGFTLNEKWGKRAFWCWLVGFYVAFMPLYILGFMGMTRRLNHYDNPLWKPYLVVAFFGAVLIFCGILVPAAASVRVRPRPQAEPAT